MKCDLFSGNFIQMETLRKGREADWRLEGIYRNFVLLLRSLRACSLGVVLGKVAQNAYINRDRYPAAALGCFSLMRSLKWARA